MLDRTRTIVIATYAVQVLMLIMAIHYFVNVICLATKGPYCEEAVVVGTEKKMVTTNGGYSSVMNDWYMDHRMTEFKLLLTKETNCFAIVKADYLDLDEEVIIYTERKPMLSGKVSYMFVAEWFTEPKESFMANNIGSVAAGIIIIALLALARVYIINKKNKEETNIQ